MSGAARLRLLGRPWLARPGQPGGALVPERRTQLMAILSHEQEWVSRERLAALFRPGRGTTAARADLRKGLHELRALDLIGLEKGPAGLRWSVDTDVREFRAELDRGDAAAARGAAALMEGLEEVRGAATFADWLALERINQLAAWRVAVLKAMAQTPVDRSLAWAEQLLGADLLDEDVVAAALRAARAQDQPELAASLWQNHEQRLSSELGMSPPRALLALAPRGQAPALAPQIPLFWRERESQQVCDRLALGRLVTLLGLGGVGKARLARHAGDALAARVAEGAAFIAVDDLQTPGELAGRIAKALGFAPAVGDDAAECWRASWRRARCCCWTASSPWSMAPASCWACW